MEVIGRSLVAIERIRERLASEAARVVVPTLVAVRNKALMQSEVKVGGFGSCRGLRSLCWVLSSFAILASLDAAVNQQIGAWNKKYRHDA
jgi:hypothetical protein